MSLNSFPNHEAGSNLEKANACLEKLRTSALDESDKQYIPEVPWTYDESGKFVASYIRDLVMSCAMSGDQDLEVLCGELNDLIEAEEKRSQAPENLNPLTPEISKCLEVLFVPFTTEAVEYLNTPGLLLKDPERLTLQAEFYKLQSYITNLYRTTDIKFRSAQGTPTIKAVMERFVLIRQAVGHSLEGDVVQHDNLFPPTYLSLIIED